MRKARKTNNKTDWHFYKTLRNRCTNSIREAKTNCNKNLLAENSNNPSRFWKIIKEIIPIKCKNATSRPFFVEAESKKSLIPLKFQTHFVPFSQMLLQHWREIHFYSKTLFGVTLRKSTKRCHLNSFSSTFLEFLLKKSLNV